MKQKQILDLYVCLQIKKKITDAADADAAVAGMRQVEHRGCSVYLEKLVTARLHAVIIPNRGSTNR